ncbi:MAG: 30S ribosomal protein S6 [Candidatus Saccharimonadales bacterium]
MNQYEIAVLLHPDLEIDLEAPLKRLDDILNGVDAKVVKRDNWGKRKLAYPIKNQTFAVYLFFVIDLDTSKVAELERALRLSDEVLRHQVVVYEPPAEEEVREDKRETKDKDKEDEDGA